MVTSLILILMLLIGISRDPVNASQSKHSQPNIIIILADDMGLDDVSFRGQNEFITPNIDALAYHGKILDRLYAPPMCTPSRSALLTGKYPIHLGMQHFVISNEEPWALPANITTMAEVFRDAGYSTNLVGKWHLGYAKREYTPTYRGFDYHYGYWGSYIDYYQRRAKMPVLNFTLGYDFRRNLDIECADLGTYVTDLLTDEAERIILQKSNTKPLFLMISHLATHTANEDDPLQAPQEEINKFSYIKDPDRRKYAAIVSKLDQSIGRIVNALETASLLQNSIIVFYSDNGAPSVGQFSNTGSNWPLRGQKNTPWEGGVRVAGALWSPLISGRSSIFRESIYVGDWLPTLAAAAGIVLNQDLNIDGKNLWPQLSSSNSKQYSENPREIIHFLDDIWQVISYMNGTWKYINGTTLNGVNDNVLTFREIYDIDPRDERYVVEIRNSKVSQALYKYDEQRLTKRRIENLRREASIKCGNMQRGCNPLVEECLFNLETDPCEQNNLANQRSFAAKLVDMRIRVRSFRRSAWPARNEVGQFDFDPTRHNCAWVNFLQETPYTEESTCNYFGPPCGT